MSRYDQLLKRGDKKKKLKPNRTIEIAFEIIWEPIQVHRFATVRLYYVYSRRSTGRKENVINTEREAENNNKNEKEMEKI